MEPLNAFMNLDDTKAGMVSLDKDVINKKIVEASLGSLYYETQLKKSTHLNKRIASQQNFLSTCDVSQTQAAILKMDKIHKELIGNRNLNHIVVHIDLDAFFAAVEMRDNPYLTSKPIAVGSMQMISTSNYIARRYGVRAAMAGFIGKKLCPELQLIPHNFYKYKEASVIFHDIVAEYDAKFYSGGLDEAYLDLTAYIKDKRFFMPEKERTFQFKRVCQCFCHDKLEYYTSKRDEKNKACCCRMTINTSQTKTSADSNDIASDFHFDVPGCRLAHQKFLEPSENSKSIITQTFGTSVEENVKEIRMRVFEAIGVTCSAGIAPTSLLAKLCTDVNKPCGQFLLKNERVDIDDFINKTPINKVNGIGKVTSALLNSLGVHTCGDIVTHKAKIGLLYTETFCRFITSVYIGGRSSHNNEDNNDDSDLDEDDESKSRKSIGRERTVTRCDARRDEALIYAICSELARKVARDMKERSIAGRVVAVKMKSSNFRVMTRMRKLAAPTNDPALILEAAWKLIKPELEIAKRAAQAESKRLKAQKSQYMNTERFFNELSNDIDVAKKAPTHNKSILDMVAKTPIKKEPTCEPFETKNHPDQIKNDDQFVEDNIKKELLFKTSENAPFIYDSDSKDFLRNEESNQSTSSNIKLERDAIFPSSNSNSPFKANLNSMMKLKRSSTGQDDMDNPEDFLYLRLLGVRMLKLVNNEVNEKQTKYLHDWMVKKGSEEGQKINDSQHLEIKREKNVDNILDQSDIKQPFNPRDVESDNESIYSVNSYSSEISDDIVNAISVSRLPDSSDLLRDLNNHNPETEDNYEYNKKGTDPKITINDDRSNNNTNFKNVKPTSPPGNYSTKLITSQFKITDMLQPTDLTKHSNINKAGESFNYPPDYVCPVCQIQTFKMEPEGSPSKIPSNLDLNNKNFKTYARQIEQHVDECINSATQLNENESKPYLSSKFRAKDDETEKDEVECILHSKKIKSRKSYQGLITRFIDIPKNL